MIDAVNTIYAHRHNPDGWFDSICTTCFATIARSRDEAALAEQEKKHLCDLAFLADRGICLNPPYAA